MLFTALVASSTDFTHASLAEACIKHRVVGLTLP